MNYDFDKWRKEYPTSTFRQQQLEWNALYDTYPNQVHWNAQPVIDALNRAGMTITELGGWQGELANHVIPITNPARWTNYDICPKAISNTVCHLPCYEPVLLSDWPWNTDLKPADAFVATHVIEHMTSGQIKELGQQLAAKYSILVIEAPVVDSATGFSWEGNGSTHILELGWEQLESIFFSLGFQPVNRVLYTRIFQKICASTG